MTILLLTRHLTQPNNCSADGATRLSYTVGWRSLLASPGASRPVRSQRGDFLSDALRACHIIDERDSATVHTEVCWLAKAQLPCPASERGGCLLVQLAALT